MSFPAQAKRCYSLVSRKLFSVPKLALLPAIVAAHPVAFAASLPGFLLVDGAKARVMARLTTAIEARRRDAAALGSARSKAGQETGDSTSLQRGCFMEQFSKEKHPRFEFAPRDDRSSKNEPK